MLAPVDIETDLVTVLAGLAESVATRVPNPRPATAIRITRTGGNDRNLVQAEPRVLVECWAGTSVAASDLARRALATIRDVYGSVDSWGGRASFTGFANFPDPDTDQPRYQFVAQIITDLEELP